jgi:hypothetical protein
MKRALVLVPAAILVFSGMAFAQSKPADAPVKAPVAAGPQAAGPVSAGPNFVDANGDGICDNYQTGQGARAGKGRRMGPADGTGNRGIGPRDGTGFGARAGAGGGNGICDGTAKGRGGAGGRRGGRR